MFLFELTDEIRLYKGTSMLLTAAKRTDNSPYVPVNLPNVPWNRQQDSSLVPLPGQAPSSTFLIVHDRRPYHRHPHGSTAVVDTFSPLEDRCIATKCHLG
ncbi:hypothetical protein HBH64_005530 [Parastagonospora nodorum]|nr:hypothetical protein HBI05_151240 [Parastagonospora nodorum]KAH4241993.1 hypothetical protein HBI06_021020 [Parastagonospora nodorum]KAH4312481.1 hypothetical protein HBI01_003080 [Parastagonospora nodorum]KAH4315907.1 hypothetical protein HBI02_040680 [Parastagonospora nodorum]KAH4332170.1 hypothetical protein HBI00_055130 [Parastagonospora nodorum]